MQYLNARVVSGKIAYKAVSKTGERIKKKVNYEPSLFLRSKTGDTKYRAFYNEHEIAVDKIKFHSISEAKSFLSQYESIENFKIYGNNKWEICFLSDFCKQYPTSNYDLSKIRLSYIDIETSMKNGAINIQNPNNEVTAITLYVCHLKKFIVFGCKEYESKSSDVLYVKCDNEHNLFERFLKVWKNCDVDMVSSWNGSFFDLPYLYNRMVVLLGEERANELSPWKKVTKRIVTIFDQEHESIDIYGIDGMDYLDLYKKFVLPTKSLKPENLKLNTVALYELGKEKLDYSEEGTLDDLYEKDFQKYIDYNIQDVKLLIELEDLLQVIKMCTQLAYDGKVNFQDTFSQVRVWDSIIFNYFRDNDLVIPMQENFEKDQKFEGAFVKPPQVGMHDWVVSFDVDSLYPNLIIQYNISPETILKKHKQENFSINDILSKKIDREELLRDKKCITGSGHFFRIDKKGFLPSILEPMYNQRKEYKNKASDCKKILKSINEEISKRGLTE